MSSEKKTIPTVSVSYAHNGASTKANALGMRPMQERVYEKRGEPYLLIKLCSGVEEGPPKGVMGAEEGPLIPMV